MLADRLNNLSSSKTSAARNEANRLKKQGISLINLTAGELAESVPLEIKEAAIKSIHQDKNRYTETIGINELRELIASHTEKRIGLPFSKKNVAVTNGAKHGLFNTMCALFNQGDNVIVPCPCWGTFTAQLSLLGVQPTLLDTTSNGFQIDTESLERLIDQNTKGIVLNTPNNPTGVIYEKETLNEIAELVKKYDLWLLFDECYHELLYPGFQHDHILTLNPEIKDKVVIIDSFSKSHALTGWRIGYVVADEALIEGIKVIQSYTTSNPNAIAQYAVLPILENPTDSFIRNVCTHLSNNYKIAKEILDTIPHISYVEPNGAFYLFVNLSWYLDHNGSSITSIDELCRYLLSQGHVAVVSGTAFYAPQHVRISISGSAQDVRAGLLKLKEALHKLPIKQLQEVLL